MRTDGLALMSLSQRVIFVTRLYRFNGFSTRQHIAYVCNALCYRPSACMPVTCPGRQSKTVEVRIMKFSPYIVPSLWLSRGEFHPEILTGSPPHQTGDCGETKQAIC